jgi:hypothetical protein
MKSDKLGYTEYDLFLASQCFEVYCSLEELKNEAESLGVSTKGFKKKIKEKQKYLKRIMND